MNIEDVEFQNLTVTEFTKLSNDYKSAKIIYNNDEFHTIEVHENIFIIYKDSYYDIIYMSNSTSYSDKILDTISDKIKKYNLSINEFSYHRTDNIDVTIDNLINIKNNLIDTITIIPLCKIVYRYELLCNFELVSIHKIPIKIIITILKFDKLCFDYIYKIIDNFKLCDLEKFIEHNILYIPIIVERLINNIELHENLYQISKIYFSKYDQLDIYYKNNLMDFYYNNLHYLCAHIIMANDKDNKEEILRHLFVAGDHTEARKMRTRLYMEHYLGMDIETDIDFSIDPTPESLINLGKFISGKYRN